MNDSANIDKENTKQKELFGHPIGLYILFFTELWERFSFYGMRAILTLYMTAQISGDNPGLGWNNDFAFEIYGWYGMLVYVLSIPGGIIADKFIGQKKTVLLGGLILVAGHSILAIEAPWAFYTGLILIVLGVGGLKPNISTMVGGLYAPGDIRRDSGFTIFYIGINIGAFLASLIVGYVGETVGWHYGFGMAGVGMLIGLLVYLFGLKHLKGIGESPSQQNQDPNQEESASLGKLFSNLLKSPLHLVITLVLIAASFIIGFSVMEGGNRYPYIALFVFLSIAAGMMMMVYKDVNKVEKDRFIVLLLSFLIVIVFWGAFEQAGGLLNIYTKEKINRTVMGFNIPAAVFQSVNPFFIIIFGTAVASFWVWWKKKGRESSSLFKMAVGTIIMGSGFIFMAIASSQASVSPEAKGMLIWLILCYLLNTLGELSASPVALSFITKIAPVKYVSIMMGFYFAATGLGNKLAGVVGQSAQVDPVSVKVAQSDVKDFVPDSLYSENFRVSAGLAEKNGAVTMTHNGMDYNALLKLPESKSKEMADRLSQVEEDDPKALLRFVEIPPNELADKDNPKYKVDLSIFQLESRREFRTFLLIFAFTAAFSILLLLFLRRLKKLTHGAEEMEGTHHEEQEPYEVADIENPEEGNEDDNQQNR